MRRARPVLSTAGALVLLAGCSVMPAVTMGGFARAPEMLPVADNSVRVAGPPGYCVDPSSSKEEDGRAFVLLASCASIANNRRATAPQIPALLTASVSVDQSTIIDRFMEHLPDFLATNKGRAVMARDARASSVEVLETTPADGALIVRLRDSSPNATPGLNPEYWRAFFSLNGRIVTLSVFEFANRPLGETQARRTLQAFVDRVRRESENGVAL